MRTWRWYSKLGFALLLAAFAYCVWPTPWRYFPPPRNYEEFDFSEVISVRLNMLSGEVQALFVTLPVGWRAFLWPPEQKLSSWSASEVVSLRRNHPHWSAKRYLQWVGESHPNWDWYAAYYAWHAGTVIDIDRLP